jgi:hypothetical protein
MDDSEEMVTSTLSASNAKSSRADDQETEAMRSRCYSIFSATLVF